MKKLNIKWKLLLMHTLAIAMLLIGTFPIMYYSVSIHLYNDMENDLVNEAKQISELLSSNEGSCQPDSIFGLIQLGTFVTIYSNDNSIVWGRLPPYVDETMPPNFGKVYCTTVNGNKWMMLDCELTKDGIKTGWFREAKSLNGIVSGLSCLKLVMCLIAPSYAIIAALIMLCGGLVAQALSPVNQITRTAKQINHDNLTQRIRFDGARDAVGMLASSFDEMLDRLEDSFDREKRFSSDVSHELRTPVAAITITAEEALNGEKTSDEYKESLNTILMEGRKMNSVISQLLMMARSGDGKLIQELESIDLSFLTKTVVDEVCRTRENSDICIYTNIEENIVMLVDQTLYIRLLFNLIDNALKYNVPGGWVKVSLSKEKNTVLLSVEDSGIGISQEDLPKIWNRFFKVSRASLNSSPGLGLSIVKWIAELNGGTIDVKSELGKGSLFEVRFKTN